MCEGASDAIFLSYYLGKIAGYKYSKKGPKNLNIESDEFEQSINWYKRDEDFLLICGVGGKDRFKEFFEKKIARPIIDANGFEKIALVLDRDNKEITSIENHASSLFYPIILKMRNNAWIDNEYINAYGETKTVEALLVTIPFEHQGALETIMLDAISEDPYDANIVTKSIEFVKSIRGEAAKYIKNDRKELKARLGVTWAIQYPEKTFKLINEQIESVEWEKYEVLRECFGKLIVI